MKTVLYSCAFVPCEWIAAHGLRPRRIAPRAAEGRGAGEGVCPLAAAMADSLAAAEDAPAVLTTVCDQMRRAHGPASRQRRGPVFLMHIPAAWQDEACGEHYVDELRRLGRFLESVGGRGPTDDHLRAVMRRYERLRDDLRALRGRLTGRQFARMCLDVTTGDLPEAAPAGPGEADGVPLALVGGPLREEDFGVYDIIESAGGRVVLDATDTGERSLPARFEAALAASSPLAALGRAYFGAIPHAFRRPNSLLYEYLAVEIAARSVRAVVFRRYRWCDTWNAEFARWRELLSVPVLSLDVGGEQGDRHRLALRVQALLEALT
jgi:benzoyl-CoA reductase/2-hydroxyglutaryl-CoA dehydratase subunit BcrC/BadD/HgdB